MAEIILNEPEQLRQTPVFTSDAERELFDREQGNEILREYQARQKLHSDQMGNTALFHESIKPVYGAIAEVHETDQGWKSRKLKKLMQKRRLKKGLRLTRNATEYTVSILEYEKKLEKDRARGKIKPPDESYTALEGLRQTVLGKRYSPVLFDQEYFGKHYGEVKAEMEELGRFLEYFGEGKERFTSMSYGDMARTRDLAKIYAAMENAMTVTLSLHGIKKEAEGFAIESHDRIAAASAHRECLQTLSGRISEAAVNETAILSMESGDIETKNDQWDWITEFPDVYKRFGFVKLADRSDYEKVSRILKLKEEAENTGGVTKSNELADRILMDALRAGEAYAYHARAYAAWEETRDTLQAIQPANVNLANPDRNDPEVRQVRSRLDYVTKRLRTEELRHQAYQQRFDTLLTGLNYLITGQREEMSRDSWRTLASYGNEEAKKEVASDLTDPQFYSNIMQKKRKLFQEACERYSAKHGNMEGVEKLNGQKVAEYMSFEDTEYNDRIIAFMVKREMFRGEDGDGLFAGKPETNDPEALALAREAAALIAPKIRAIEEYNTGGMENLSPEDLSLKLAELQELVFADHMINDLRDLPMKVIGLTAREKEQLLELPDKIIPDDETPEEEIRRERYAAKWAAYTGKNWLIKGLHHRARAAALFSVAQLSEEIPFSLLLTEREKADLERKCRGRSDREKLFIFAHDEYRDGIFAEDNAKYSLLSADRGIYQHLKKEEQRSKQKELAPYMDGYMPPQPVFLDKGSQEKSFSRQYAAIESHYGMVERKYGHELPDLAFMMEHRSEMLRDLHNIDSDLELLEKDRDVLIQETEGALRLLHVLRYFRHFRDCIADIIPNAILREVPDVEDNAPENGDADFRPLYRRLIGMAKAHLAEVSQDLEYLKEHPQKGN